MSISKGSRPPPSLFKSINTLILLAILSIIFFTYIQGMEKKVEEVSLTKSLNEINAVLSVLLYQYIIQNRHDELEQLNNQNPFIIPEIKKLPIHYIGELEQLSELEPDQAWYFNPTTQEVGYHSTHQSKMFRLKFKYADNNQNGVFDLADDQLNGLVLE